MAGEVVCAAPPPIGRTRKGHLPPFAPVVLAAWAVLVFAQLMGSGHHLDHDALLAGDTPSLAGLGVFVVSWLAMVIAMMVPATWLIRGPGSGRLETDPSPGALLEGFVAVWAGVGAVALAFDSSVHRAVQGIPALEARSSLVMAAVLAVAGIFQVLPSTPRHLAATGPIPAPSLRTWHASFVAGRNHGLRCLRPDGPLMLVMFATGDELALMVVLTVVMVAERLPRFGPALAAAAGGGLLVAAFLTASQAP